MVKKLRKYSSSKRLVAGTMGALSVFALTTQANNIVEAKAKNTSTNAEESTSMSSSASAIRHSGQLSLAPIQSSTASKSASAAQNGLYVVKSGDTLSELAVQFNVSLNDLVAWNNIQNPDLIYVGQQLSIDGKKVSSAVSQSSAAPVTQPQSFTATENEQPAQAQAASEVVNEAVQPANVQQPVTQQYTSNNQQGQLSQTVNSAYTSAANAAAYNSAAPSQQSAAVQVQGQQTTQQASSANAVQNVTYDSASQAATVDQVAVQNQQAINSAAAQPVQSQAPQSQVTQQVTSQQPASQSNVDLQSGSVVSLASKIATSNSVPYQWGGNSLSGMDCSGFVQYVYANAEGKQLPHNSAAMESYVNQKPVSQAQAGDLLFWGNHGSSYHVAIYMGNNQYAAAAKPGTNVAIYNLSSYFEPSFAGTVK